MEQYPKVSIIILNRNWRQDTIECLESVYRIDYPNYEVILVDNGSSNESIEKVRAWTHKQVEVSSKYFETTTCTHDLTIYEYTKEELENGSYLEGKKRLDPLPSNKKLFLLKNDQNYGFAEGNNIAMRQVLSESSSDYILCLNNDTIVKSDILKEMMYTYKKSNQVWIVAPVNLNYYDWNIDFYGWGINRVLGWPFHYKKENHKKYFPIVVWTCMLIRTERLKQFGYFDPSYFCYMEESDLCIRMYDKGYNHYLARNTCIYHKINWSTKGSTFSQYSLAKNRIIFMKKNSRWYINRVIFIFIQVYLKKLTARILFDSTRYQAYSQWIKDWLNIVHKM